MSLISDIFGLFFPPLCRCCQKRLVDNENYICFICQYNLPVTNYHKIRNNKLEEYLAGRICYERASVYAHFIKGGSISKLIYELKYKNNPSIGLFIGKLCGENLKNSEFLNDIDFLVPVPLHPNKEKQRGYNQSSVIAEGISMITGLPLIKDNVIRIIDNPTQTNKTKTQRWENVEDIFFVKDYQSLRDKHILLIDDVITTGSTLESCARSVKKEYDIRISIYTVGWALI